MNRTELARSAERPQKQRNERAGNRRRRRCSGLLGGTSRSLASEKKQLCWLHKIRNILDKLPKKEHKEATERIRAVYLAEERENAERLAKNLMNDWKQVGYLKAVECLERALERLLTFHAFPPEHARHLRTTNPIESPFAAVKLRTNAARRFRTPRSALHLLFKLLERSEKGWQRLSFPEKLKEVKLPNNPL